MKKFLLAGVAAVAMSVSAQAAQVNGTFAAAIVGVSTVPASIGLGTTFTNTVFTIIGSGTGDFSGAASTIITITDQLTATAGDTFAFTSSIGSFLGSVQALGLTATGAVTNRTVDAYVLGSFTPTFGGFTVGPASATFSFTQTGAAAAVSGSFSFSSPPTPPTGVPAPAALALFGLGLAGLGFTARRKA